MTETFPQYRESPCRLPEYFFLEVNEECYRIRVPWIAIQAVVEIIESPQGERKHSVRWNYIPGPRITRLVSTGGAEYLLSLAREEGWIE